jgi:preprotein translocase subunit Sss1
VFSAYTKTFAGLTGALTALALLVAALQPDRLAVTLLFLAAASTAIITVAARAATGHNDRIAMVGASAAANRPPRQSYSPALAALALGVVVLGAALGFIAYAIGGALLAIAAGLWMSDTWREHRLTTPKASAMVGRSFSQPIVMPLVVLGLIAFVAISFSLVFFSFPESSSWIVASVVATAVFAGAFVLAFMPKRTNRAKFLAFTGALLAAIAVLGLVGLLRGEPEHGEHSDSHGGTHSEKTAEKTSGSSAEETETHSEG